MSTSKSKAKSKSKKAPSQKAGADEDYLEKSNEYADT